MSVNIQKKKYEESDKVKDALEQYNRYKESARPDDYSFSDSSILSETQNKYFNHPSFSYDPDSDPVYNQYKQIYQAQSKKAMENAIGNAASLTGGYGNSYAQTVGLTSYNDNMSKLNDILPELYSAAYSRYSDEFDRLENKLNYLSAKDKAEYSRYLDSYDAYSDELESLRKMYQNEYDNDIDIWNSEWEAAYKLAMAEQDKEISDAELAYKYYVADQNQSQFDSELEYKKTAKGLDTILKNAELQLEKEKEKNSDKQFWAKFENSNREYVSENDIYTLLGSKKYYDTLAALDYNYDDDEMVRYRALAMGIDEKYIDAYFAAK